ncbi:MAG: hypothetical protein ACP5JR_02180 [Thermoplasmata archaeon]
MAEKEDFVRKMLSITKEVLNPEDFIVDATKDLIKEEIKDYLKNKLNENPEIKKEFREAIAILIEARMREMYAIAKIGKCTAKLGLAAMPPEMKEEMVKSFVALFEKELNEILDRTL